MKNEISHKFRKFLAFSECFWRFVSKYRDSSSFPEHFCEIPANFIEISQKNRKFPFFFPSRKFHRKTRMKNLDRFSLRFWDLSGAKAWKSCRSRKMLQNEPTLAIVAVHEEENEPLEILKWFFIASILSLLLGESIPRQKSRRWIARWFNDPFKDHSKNWRSSTILFAKLCRHDEVVLLIFCSPCPISSS